MTLVTRDGWSVGYVTGYGIEGAELRVSRSYPPGTFRADGVRRLGGDRGDGWGAGVAYADGSGHRYGDGHGQQFADVATAQAWALAHGYLQPYRPRAYGGDR